MKAHTLIGWILVACLAIGTMAYAESVTFHFTGTTLNSSGFAGQKTGFWAAEASNDVTGFFTYDTDRTDIIAGSSSDKFTSSSGGGWELSITLGDPTNGITRSVTGPPPFFSLTLWDGSSAGIDRLQYVAGGSTPDVLTVASIDLRDTAAWGNDAVSGLGIVSPDGKVHPPDTLEFSKFDGVSFGNWNGINNAPGFPGNNDLKFRITDVYLWDDTGGPSPVPEPATLLLLGSGLAGMALKKRRSNRRP